jgi:hypothetical protein
MKLKEIISEGKIGQFPGSMHRITAPYTAGGPRVTEPGFIKSGKQKKYQRTVDFNALKTDREKFEFLHNLKSGKTVNKITFEIPGTTGSKMVKYNPQTGEVELQIAKGSIVDLYSANSNNFKFLGREKSPSTNHIKYKFSPGTLEQIGVVPRKTKPQAKPFSKPSTLTKLPW